MKVEVKGMDRILKKMANMERKESQKAIRKGVHAGRKQTLREAKSRASSLERVGTGMAEAIADALVIRVVKQKTLKRLGYKSAYAKEVTFNTSKYPQLIHYPKGSYSERWAGRDRRGRLAIKRKTFGKRSFIPYAIEYGHAGPGNHGGGRVAAPKPFIRPAHEATKKQSIRDAKATIIKHISGYWNGSRV